jgi:hypothetical protein
MAENDSANQGIQSRQVRDLANAMQLAQDKDEKGRGRGIFLIGAGCSVSAGIPMATGVAKHCALQLAKTYSRDVFVGDDADAALNWLIDNKRVKLHSNQAPKTDGTHWGALYSYFFEAHFNAPNQQRDIINDLIDKADDKLNWAHACLGELVQQRYVHSVLTTNFDQLVLQGIVRTGLIPVIADSLESLNRIDGKPRRPQIVHIHGSMHTYNLRNSTSALQETSDDGNARAMVYGLLQQCDLLVVVGYAGGEEGVMALLCEAAKTHPKLPIYWVTYERNTDHLSERCNTLLTGENKFTIWGGEADKFFGDLMSELGIGQPAWVADPISGMVAQSKKLVIDNHNADLETVRILVQSFNNRIQHASNNRLLEVSDVKGKAAQARARGDFNEARKLLDSEDLSDDNAAARLHALNALSIFDEDPDSNASMLDAAICEFKGLIEKTVGEERLKNVLSLMDALWDLRDVEDDAATQTVLDQIVALCETSTKEYDRDSQPSAWATLRLRGAEALLVQGENPVDLNKLDASRVAFEESIGCLEKMREPSGELNDARAGLAAALQVIGEANGDVSLLSRSVSLHREVSEAVRSSKQTIDSAGPAENLAGALTALATYVPQEDANILREEARTALLRAERLYELDGDECRVASIRSRLDELIHLLGVHEFGARDAK